MYHANSENGYQYWFCGKNNLRLCQMDLFKLESK
ncbi:hypothetical protein VCE7224_01074 [Vibrio celticus]|uniref:Uncharacterized protein n=1 Tax=Vibrio celticus TaxID=446372 RepID=A0A1C3JAY3_9VIBR|nr:hypothetical protein VCE7224_01074 [Vibrio celticus]